MKPADFVQSWVKETALVPILRCSLLSNHINPFLENEDSIIGPNQHARAWSWTLRSFFSTASLMLSGIVKVAAHLLEINLVLRFCNSALSLVSRNGEAGPPIATFMTPPSIKQNISCSLMPIGG